MPNYARTTVVITGPKEDRDRLKQLVEGETPCDLIEWSFINWGTKWNTCDCLLLSYKGEKLKYRISTAWSEPLPVF